MAEGLGEGARGQGPCWQKTCLLLLDYFRAHRCQPRLVPETGGGGAGRQLSGTEFAARTAQKIGPDQPTSSHLEKEVVG